MCDLKTLLLSNKFGVSKVSYNFAAFRIIVFVVSPYAIELSVVTSVLDCGWPVSSNVVRNGAAALQLWNISAVSSSEAEVIMYFMIFDNARIAPLLKSSPLYLPRKKRLAALLLDSSSKRNDASECRASSMSRTTNCTHACGYVAQ